MVRNMFEELIAVDQNMDQSFMKEAVLRIKVKYNLNKPLPTSCRFQNEKKSAESEIDKFQV